MSILLNYPRLNEHLTKWLTDTATIPNEQGYCLVIKRHSDELQFVTRVERTADGHHFLLDIPINSVKAWRPLDTRDKEVLKEALTHLWQPLDAVCEVLVEQNKDSFAESLQDIYTIAKALS